MSNPDPKHAQDLFDIIYRDADSNSIIPVGSRRITKTDPDNEKICYFDAIPIRDRREIIPQLFELAIEQTMYFMPNTLGQDALHNMKKIHDKYTLDDYQQRRIEGATTGQFKPLYYHAANAHVRELVAITVDLDVGRDAKDMTADMAVGYALSLARSEKIPLPSLTAASGRGAYLLWLLQDAETGKAPQASKANVDRWRKTLAELIKRLDGLKPDTNATRPANWFKLPGTVDTKTGNLVYYSAHMVGTLAEIPRYDLTKLVSKLDLFDEPLEVKQLPPAQTTFKPKKLNVRNVKPGKGSEPLEKCIREIELIAQGRQGIDQGLREITLFYYYLLTLYYYKMCLKDNAAAATAAQNRTVDFNKHYFTPPLEWPELRSIFRQKLTYKRPTNDKLASQLGVTVQEARKLRLQSILPPELVEAKHAAERREKAKRKIVHDYHDVVRESIIAQLLNPDTTNSPTKIAVSVTENLPPEVLRSLKGQEVSRQLVNKYKQQLIKAGRLQPKKAIEERTLFDSQ